AVLPYGRHLGAGVALADRVEQPLRADMRVSVDDHRTPYQARALDTTDCGRGQCRPAARDHARTPGPGPGPLPLLPGSSKLPWEQVEGGSLPWPPRTGTGGRSTAWGEGGGPRPRRLDSTAPVWPMQTGQGVGRSRRACVIVAAATMQEGWGMRGC